MPSAPHLCLRVGGKFLLFSLVSSYVHRIASSVVSSTRGGILPLFSTTVFLLVADVFVVFVFWSCSLGWKVLHRPRRTTTGQEAAGPHHERELHSTFSWTANFSQQPHRVSDVYTQACMAVKHRTMHLNNGYKHVDNQCAGNVLNSSLA
jgi:hypothetical protein